jgi:hypothetical protein
MVPAVNCCGGKLYHVHGLKPGEVAYFYAS